MPNLNRAREGLRVVEDWCRLVLQRPELVAQLKDYRQRLGQCHSSSFKQARHAASDPATGLAHQAQQERSTPQQVVAANCARVQEALRVLEEFGRHGAAELAATAATIRYGLYDLETALLANQDRHQTLRQARLYLVTQPVPELYAVVKACLEAGLRLVQYREKTAQPGHQTGDSEVTDCQRLRTATALRQLCWDHGALFIVNDRVDLALSVEADGVHLGQGDLPPLAARRLLGPGRLIGRSTHCLEHLHPGRCRRLRLRGCGTCTRHPHQAWASACGPGLRASGNSLQPRSLLCHWRGESGECPPGHGERCPWCCSGARLDGCVGSWRTHPPISSGD